MKKNIFIIFFIIFFMQKLLFCSSSSTNYVSAFGEMIIAQPTMEIQLKFPYNINTEIITTTITGTGTVTSTIPFAVLQTSAAANSSATLVSKDRLHYQPGQGCAVLCTAIFTTGVANSTQIIGIGNTQDGFFFGYNGAAFGVLHRKNSVDTWVAQTAWNGDKFDGTGLSGVTLIPTNGNVFKIQYQWLGFGIIKFMIENPSTGEFTVVHSIQYANANTTASLLNPSLQLRASVVNTTNATNITLRTSCMTACIEGKIIMDLGLRNSLQRSKNATTTEGNILTIRNKSTYQAINNQVMIYPDQLSVMHTPNNDVIYKLWLNATIGGAPAFTDVSTATSVVDFDTAGTTITGGTLLATFFTMNNTASMINLNDFHFRMAPGDTLTIGATTVAGNGITRVSISWIERF